MNHTKGQNGVNTILLALILVIHTWIGISVSNLIVHPVVAPSAPPESERVMQTLASLDRLVASLHPAVGGKRGGTPTDAEFANYHSIADGPATSLPQPPVETRTHLPNPLPRSHAAIEPRRDERHYYDLAERIAPRTAADNLRGIRMRIRSSGKVESRAARQSVLLMTRTMVLEEFGKPSRINLTQSGHESWTWRSGEGKHLLSIVFRDEYAISVN